MNYLDFEDHDERADKWERKIIRHYLSHGVEIEITRTEIIGKGERFIYQVKLKKGAKVQRFFDRATDIQLALRLPLFITYRQGVSLYIAVSEINNAKIDLLKIIANPMFRKHKMNIPFIVGRNVRGENIVLDLAKLPHLLVGGSTQSGKTVLLQCLLICIIALQSVRRINLIVFDLGANDLTMFDGTPHLSCPIIKDMETAVKVIMALEAEMERRITNYEESDEFPAIVCVLDEFSSFISNINDKKSCKMFTSAISNLLRRGRKARIHMVLAAQDPTKDIMKVELGNITARMAFTCAKYQNSIAIVGVGGAEKLSGKGAMLFKSPEHPEPVYIQGAFVQPDIIKELVHYISSQPCDATGKFEILESELPDLSGDTSVVFGSQPSRQERGNKELARIILWALSCESISTLQIMKCFRIGNRARIFMDELYEMGIIANKYANLPRAVLPKSIEEMPAETIDFLLNNGIPKDKIVTAIERRSTK